MSIVGIPQSKTRVSSPDPILNAPLSDSVDETRSFIGRGAAANIWLIEKPGSKYVAKVLRLRGDHVTTSRLIAQKADAGSAGFSGSIALDLQSKVTQWSSLRHENLVRVIGIDEPLQLQVEYCERGTARQYLEECGYSLDAKNMMVQHILSGMHYLHSQNPPVVHGSLRLDKVFVNNQTAKVGEFGLASLMRNFAWFAPSVSQADLTRWMSPELLDTDPDIDPNIGPTTPTTASDVWAFGCTVSEVITGEIPYQRYKHELRAWQAICVGELPCLGGAQDTSFPWSVVLRCWDVPPENRISISAIFDHHPTMSSSEIEPPLTSELGTLTTTLGTIHLTGDLVPVHPALVSDRSAVPHEVGSMLSSISGGVPSLPHDHSSRSRVPDPKVILELKEEPASPVLVAEERTLDGQDLSVHIKKDNETDLLKREHDKKGLFEAPSESKGSSQRGLGLDFDLGSSSYMLQDEHPRSYPVVKDGPGGDVIGIESVEKFLGKRKYFVGIQEETDAGPVLHCISLDRNLMYTVGDDLRHIGNCTRESWTNPSIVDFPVGLTVYRWYIESQVLQWTALLYQDIWHDVVLYDEMDSAQQNLLRNDQSLTGSALKGKGLVLMDPSSAGKAINSYFDFSAMNEDTFGLQQGLDQGFQCLPLESPTQSHSTSTLDSCSSHTWLVTDNKRKEDIDEYVQEVQGDPKKYPCPVLGCQHNCERRDALKDHLYRHYQIKPYQCDTCSTSFVTRVGLRRHSEEVHEGKCRYCKEVTPSGQRKKNHRPDCTLARKREADSMEEASKRRRM